MSGTSFRRQVLASFKRLHQTRKNVFKGDAFALAEARKHINHEYSINKNQMDEAKIAGMVQYAEEVEEVMRKTIIQAVKTKEGHYRAAIRKDVELLDNANPQEALANEMIESCNQTKGTLKENQ